MVPYRQRNTLTSGMLKCCWDQTHGVRPVSLHVQFNDSSTAPRPEMRRSASNLRHVGLFSFWLTSEHLFAVFLYGSPKELLSATFAQIEKRKKKTHLIVLVASAALKTQLIKRRNRCLDELHSFIKNDKWFQWNNHYFLKIIGDLATRKIK